MAEGISIGGRPAGRTRTMEAIPSEPGAPAVVDLGIRGGLLAQARADARGRRAPRSGRASAPACAARGPDRWRWPGRALLATGRLAARALGSLPAVCRCRRDLRGSAARASWSPFRPSGMPSTARGRRLPAHRHPARALLRAFAHPSPRSPRRDHASALPASRSEEQIAQRAACAICPSADGVVGWPGSGGVGSSCRGSQPCWAGLEAGAAGGVPS